MAGLKTYLKFIIRRERVMSSIWIGLCVVITMLVAMVFPSLLGDEAAKTAMKEMLKSPAMAAMLGPSFDTADYKPAVTFAQMMTIWMMIATAVMNIFFVGRHTRADEEQGRLEMLRSLPLGKMTNAVATIILSVALNLIIALLSTAAILIVGFEGSSVAGAFAYSFAIAAFGIVMAGTALLCAQIFSTLRGANGAAFAVLGVFYLMRAAGDYTDGVISYLSPMGLGLRVFAFYQNNAYPIIVLIALAGILAAVAIFICAKRDVGEGIIAAKKGKANASKWMLSPFGLALKLCKSSCIVWCVVIFIIGAMYGTMMENIEEFLNSNDFYKQILDFDAGASATLTEGFIGMLFLIIAHIAVISVIMVANRIHSEEHRGRLEQIFARSVSRRELIIAFAIIAFIQSVLVLLSAALGVYSTCMGVQSISLGSMLATSMSYLPAMWFFASLGIMFSSTFPRQTIVVWLIFGYSFAITYLGEMLKLPEFFKKLTPFHLVPRLPIEDFSIVQALILTLLAAAATTLGVWRYGRRDISQ